LKHHRQISFLATSLAQLDLIKQFYLDDRYIVICDRCFIDPFVFYYLNSPETVFVEKKNELLDLIGFLNVEFSFSYQFYYLNLPQKDEVIEKCFEDETRKNTIDIETIKEKDEKFYEKYCLFVGNRIPRYIHPSDNSYVVYKIVDEIIEKLR